MSPDIVYCNIITRRVSQAQADMPALLEKLRGLKHPSISRLPNPRFLVHLMLMSALRQPC